MGLKFRRGTTAQQSGSLAFGEPYVNTTLGTLVVGGPDGDIVLSSGGTGSTGNFGAISGSGLDITGNTSIGGNLTVGGKLTIGDATSDTVNVVASLSSSLIPSHTNAFDLGSENYFWRDLYISTGSIKFIGEAGQIAGTFSNTLGGFQTTGDLVVGYDPNTTIGVTVGRGKGSNTTFNTALGWNALGSNTTGTHNTAVGAGAIGSTTTGEANTAFGQGALAGNVIGSSNTVVGAQAGALLNNVGNTAIGHRALSTGIDAGSNVAIGYEALRRLGDGAANTAIGYLAGQYSSGSSNSNLYLGYQAGSTASVEETGKLYINNAASNTPLIGGNFTQREVDINGRLKVVGNQILSGSMTISGSILPSHTNAFDLGSETKFWRDIYVSTGSIKFVGAAGTVVGTLTNVGNGLNLDGGIVTNGNSTFGTSSLSTTAVTGSLLVNGNVRVTNGGITGSIAATNGVVSGSSQVTLSGTTGFDTFSSSLDSRISTEKGRVDAILLAADADKDSFAEIVTLINSVDTTNDNAFASFYTASVGRLNNLESTSASVNVSVSNLNTYTGSNNTTNTTQNTRLTALEASASTALSTNNTQATSITNLNSATASLMIETANLETFSSSALTRLTNLETETSNLESFTSSINTTIKTRLNAETVVSGSSQVIGILSSLNSYTASNDTTNTTQNSRLDQLSTASGSALTRLSVLEIETSNLELTTASLNISVNNLNSFSASENTKAAALATITGSLITTASTLTQRVGAIETVSGTYARTNSANTFNGSQIVSGSLTVTQDLVVLGSSSIQNVSSSTLNIGTNLITVAVNQPSVRFGGIAVIDSGSSGGSGSFLYDSVQDEFIFVHRGNGTNVTSSHFVLGPETYDNLGNETYLTNNRLPKGTGKEHLVDSNIADTGTEISLNSLTSVTGSLKVSDGIYGVINATNGVISGSSQLTATLPAGVVSGSSQLENAFEGKANSIKTIISGSSQLETAFEGRANSIKTIISGSSQLETAFEGRANSIKTIISGSTQLESAFEGRANSIKTIISGSSQLATDFEGRANVSKTIFSGSSQVIGILSSLNTYTGSNDTTNTTQNSRLDQLSTASGSAISRLSALEVETANLESFSSSALTRLSNLEGTDITITLTGDVTGTGTITNLGNVSFATTVAANQVALGTDTTGDYVASLVAGTGVTLSNNSGESATPTIAIGQAVATSSNVQFNSLGIGMAASATAGRIDATNDIVAYSSSDIRFKENIKAIENPIEKIRKISGNTYDWKAENKIEHGYEGNDVGVIAQEIEAVLPQLVQTRDNGYKAVKYDKLVALLIEGIKEQQIQIDSLTLQMEELKKQKGL